MGGKEGTEAEDDERTGTEREPEHSETDATDDRALAGRLDRYAAVHAERGSVSTRECEARNEPHCGIRDNMRL